MTLVDYIKQIEEQPTDLKMLAEAKKMKKAIKEVIDKKVKQNAFDEHVLRYDGEKGMGLSSVTTHNYEYEQDDLIDKYQSELKPLKKKAKSLKDSIKERKKELKDEEKYTKTVKSQYLRS